MARRAAHVGRLIEHLEGYTNPITGAPFQVEPWQRSFLDKAFRPDTLRANLTCGRGGGKSTLIGALAASAIPGAPLYRPGGEVLVISAGLRQAEQPFQRAVQFLGELGKDWKVRRTNAKLEIWHPKTEFRILCLPCKARTAHGYHPVLVLADEPSQWEPSWANDTFAVLKTSLSKVAGSKLIAVGTFPSAVGNWFRQELESPPEGVVSVIHKAKSEALNWKNTLLANPAARHRPEMAKHLKAELKSARSSSNAEAYRSYHMNLGDRYSRHDPVILRPEWEACVKAGEAPEGSYILGFDIGAGRSWCGVSALHLDGKVLQAFGVVGDEITLEERCARELAKPEDLRAMVDRQELVLAPGRAPRPAVVLEEALKRWGRDIAGIVADRFRSDELQDAVRAEGLDHVPFETRRMGPIDGAEDITAFRTMIQNREVEARPNFALSYHICNAVMRWTAGSTPAPQKAGSGSDDLAWASILACGYLNRMGVVEEEIYEPIFAPPELGYA